MTKDITIYLKAGSTLRFSNVSPFTKKKVVEESEDLEEHKVKITKDELSDYIHDDYFIKLRYISESSKDENVAVFLKEHVAGISITSKKHEPKK